MKRLTVRAVNVAVAVWANRPSSPELLCWMLLIAILHWLLGLPWLVLITGSALIVVAGTFSMALRELRTAGPYVEGGHDAD